MTSFSSFSPVNSHSSSSSLNQVFTVDKVEMTVLKSILKNTDPLSVSSFSSLNNNKGTASDHQILKSQSIGNVDEIVSIRPSVVKVFFVVSFYIITSIMMVLINKVVLNQTKLPMTFLLGQIAVAVILLEAANKMRILKLPPLNLTIIQSLFPLIVMNVIGLALNTFCLNYLDAMLYQVSRSLILPITVFSSPIILKDYYWPRRSVLLSCVIIFFGFFAGIFGEREVQISQLGIFFGIASSFSTAIHTIVIKMSFQSVQHNGAFDMVYYNNILSLGCLLPLLLWESPKIMEFYALQGMAGIKLLFYGICIAGIAGLLINISSFLQIKVTSPLTHTVSSAARGVLQTMAANLFLLERITKARIIGIAVTLTGSCMYSWFKATECNKIGERLSKTIENQSSYKLIEESTENKK